VFLWWVGTVQRNLRVRISLVQCVPLVRFQLKCKNGLDLGDEWFNPSPQKWGDTCIIEVNYENTLLFSRFPCKVPAMSWFLCQIPEGACRDSWGCIRKVQTLSWRDSWWDSLHCVFLWRRFKIGISECVIVNAPWWS